jgi:hypothetical protein
LGCAERSAHRYATPRRAGAAGGRLTPADRAAHIQDSGQVLRYSSMDSPDGPGQMNWS